MGVVASAVGVGAAGRDRIGSGRGRAGAPGRGGRGLGRGLAGDGGLRAWLCVVVRGRQRPPRTRRRGRHRFAGAGGRDGGPRAARGGGDQRHADQRALAGGVGGRAGPPRPERPAGPGTQDRPAVLRRIAGDGLAGGDRGRRPAAGGTGRRAPGRWHRDRGGRGPGRVRDHRRSPAGRARARRQRPQRDAERGRPVRPAGRDKRRRQHLRRDHPPGLGGGTVTGAVRPARRPVCDVVPAADPGRSRVPPGRWAARSGRSPSWW